MKKTITVFKKYTTEIKNPSINIINNCIFMTFSIIPEHKNNNILETDILKLLWQMEVSQRTLLFSPSTQ